MHFGHKLITFAVGLAIAVGAQALPQVKILATGGTIAGTASSSTQMTGYKAGNLGCSGSDQRGPADQAVR